MYEKGIKVPPKSRSEIESIAWGIRKISGYSSNVIPFPVMDFLEHKLSMIIPDFDYEIVEDGTLKARAITYPDQKLIQIEEAVYNGACDHVGKDRMTISHEIGHLIMHHGVPMAKNYEQVSMKIYEDSEWQADVFAGELLAPIKLIKGMMIEDIAYECKVSYKAANAQFRALYKKLRCA
ncbi:MAG: ImmA/IrrE family metallo-endopeptidase [Synergistaceae bacterium]|nr:ImmA/IrrE family metallo-endopeptidase [Synergistaceae bacterium]